MDKKEKAKLSKRTRIVIKVIFIEVVVLLVGCYFLINAYQGRMNHVAEQSFKFGVHYGFQLGTKSACKGV